MKVLYFTSPSCGPCRTYGPLVEALAAEMGVELEKISLTSQDAYDRAAQYHLGSVPTLVCEPKQGLLRIAAGATPRARLAELFTQWLMESV